MSKQKAKACQHLTWCSLAAAALVGCAYRFTNTHLSPPRGVHSLAVEAVYDTSREVIPHELLWESLQEAFAVDGHLRLAPQSEADALLRAHIKAASVTATGANKTSRGNINLQDDSVITKDPTFTEREVPKFKAFRRLGVAGEYRDQANISWVVVVEIYDLNTQQVLLNETYPLSGDFRAIHSSEKQSDSVTTIDNDFLRYDESARAQFKRLAANVATRVVSDLLVR